MKGIQLKLSGEWVALPEDFSLKLSQTNPLFNDDGVFSFPFEVPLEPNRVLFKNIADPFGDIELKEFDGMEAELWFNGVLLYKGITETDEEIEIEDSIPMRFLSGNGDFMKRIEGLNAQDIPLDREIKLGYVVTKAIAPPSSTGSSRNDTVNFPEGIMMNYTNYNISNPYPIGVFCNARVCTSNENGKYKTLEAKRPFSGVCFYVMYLLDLLFDTLKISVSRNDLGLMEDMSRLAFFTTKCESYLSEEEVTVPLSEIRSKDFAGEEFKVVLHRNREGRAEEVHVETNSFTYKKRDMFATNKNFPDISITDVIEDFNTAFGVRFIQDVRSNSISILYLKDIFKSEEIVEIGNTILSYGVNKRKNANILLTYGVSDNTAFNYDDYRFVKEYDGYKLVLAAGISSFSRDCAIDKLTGNAYRVKVNKETGGDPSLFEVGGYRDYEIGEKETEEKQSLSINFAPVMVNDTTGGDKYHAGRRDRSAARASGTDNTDQTFAVFADVELISAEVFDGELYTFMDGTRKDYKYGYVYLKANAPEQYDKESEDESPLRTYDGGYTLGIMRGPGSDSKVEYVEDYDGEGNASWVQTAANYAFTSDSCDNFGRFFDYNGTEAGGADQSGRFSLKLDPVKEGFPIDSNYAQRGLVSKFLSEYLYFLAHRKTVLIEVDMNIVQLINLDMMKRHKIGDFVGFINSISYSMTVNGMEDVTIEMYTL